MWPVEIEKRWRDLIDEAIGGMDEWRRQHPRATFKEIEMALDERLAKVRAQMLEDAAMHSPMTDIAGAKLEDRPRCPNPECRHPLEARGLERRSLRTDYEQTISLNRSYAVCPSCGTELFPPR